MSATPTIGIPNYCYIPCFFSFDKLFIFLCFYRFFRFWARAVHN